ncbi:tetratricopeptide repeat protein [Candidatus Methanodesulfokora washburnensis]|uniref:Tetratricopeptide repeat protein n=1 Tax=Candidatus Methanodesulfokora washburnensis TaxID=2478471 RepID=A0A3R9QVV5_9CREN|nr:tetratricopeptide repeat protein [Candidatus Methanodesulfokores washburnensis]
MADVLEKLGEALLKKGALDEAINKLEEAERIYKDQSSTKGGYLWELADVLEKLGEALLKKGALDEAINKLEEAERIYRDLSSANKRYLPDLAKVLEKLGEALLKKGALDEAINKLEEAERIYKYPPSPEDLFSYNQYLPSLADVLEKLGEALLKKGMKNKAMKKLKEADRIYRRLSKESFWDALKRALEVNMSFPLLFTFLFIIYCLCYLSDKYLGISLLPREAMENFGEYEIIGVMLFILLITACIATITIIFSPLLLLRKYLPKGGFKKDLTYSLLTFILPWSLLFIHGVTLAEKLISLFSSFIALSFLTIGGFFLKILLTFFIKDSIKDTSRYLKRLKQKFESL